MALLQLLFSLVSITFLTSVDSGRIVNGTNTQENEYPFVVSLQNNSNHLCGGTILNEKFILTAAHCVCDVSLVNLTVHLTHYQDKPREKISVQSIVCHNYSTIEHINDIAILELETTISDPLYQPVKLVSRNFTCENDRNAILIGWGLTEAGTAPNALVKVDVIAYSDSSCAKSHFEMYDMEKNMCAGWPENGRGSCRGDSGGPLLIEGAQAGIISFGISSDCGISSREQPKVLTRISKYVDWIQENSKYGADGDPNGGVTVELHNLLLCVFVFLMLF